MGRMTDRLPTGIGYLERLRTGGTQRVLVQHVTVGGGGKAVVDGEISGGGAREKMQGEGDENGQ